MNKPRPVYWVSAAVTALCGIAVIVFGIQLAADGQDCKNYADLGCAFRGVFGAVFIPYGALILLLAGLASLPVRMIRLIGSVLSMLTGVMHMGLCCFVASWAFNVNGGSFEEIALFLLLPLFIFASAIALLGMGFTGYKSLE